MEIHDLGGHRYSFVFYHMLDMQKVLDGGHGRLSRVYSFIISLKGMKTHTLLICIKVTFGYRFTICQKDSVRRIY